MVPTLPGRRMKKKRNTMNAMMLEDAEEERREGRVDMRVTFEHSYGH